MRIVYAIVIVLLSLTLGCSGEKKTSSAPEEKTAAVTTEGKAACTVKMNVDGMACNVGCPPVVKKTLMSVAGVNEVDVSFENSMATITASEEGCNQDAQNAMIEALKAKDYKASIEASAGSAEKDPT